MIYLPYGGNLSILQYITSVKCQEDVTHHLHLVTVMSPTVIELAKKSQAVTGATQKLIQPGLNVLLCQICKTNTL